MVLCHAQLPVQIVLPRRDESIAKAISIEDRHRTSTSACLLYTSTPGSIKTSTQRAMSSISRLKPWPGDAQSPPNWDVRSRRFSTANEASLFFGGLQDNVVFWSAMIRQ
ncbi:hypothetical protein P692DRAFT_201155464 [Suillus brevipes Sb2]|nr:hypothetical protein P692DRAFT_201155464 [Suillus brevipes Sb2]